MTPLDPTNRARLLVPGLRFDAAIADPDPFLRLAARGVGGFCVFGGDGRLPALLRRLREAAPHPLLLASDLENGAGQQIAGLTRHPCARALDPAAARDAGRLTAIEARPAGITMTFAPVCDVRSHPRNPILNARCFADPAASAAAFLEGAREFGLRGCAKHFPGHGATSQDSHDALPIVRDDAGTWRARDLPPFAAVFRAGVDAVMTAHIACPALTGEEWLPATLSRRVMTDLLRGEMGFGGLAISDALLMDGVKRGRSEGEAAVEAIEAGCDAVLYPEDVEGVLRSLERVGARRAEEALARIARAAEPPPIPPPADPGPLRHSLAAAARASVRSSGNLPLRRGPHPLIVCDLHGEGEEFVRRCPVAWELRAPDGSLRSRGGPAGGAAGLEAPALALLRRDKAWGGPFDPPAPVRRIAARSALLLVLGPESLLEGIRPASWVQAPGEDAETVAELFRRAVST